MSWNNFADAEEQTGGDVIPHKTLAKVHMKIRPGGYTDQIPAVNPYSDASGHPTRSDRTGAIYLDCEFTVIGGKYNKRKVWTLIGLYSPKGPKWEGMGRSFIRAALESARGVKASDASETAMKARQISGFGDLNGLEFVAQIDVDKADEDSEYGDKNKINNVIPVGHKEYAALMAGTAPVDMAPSAQKASGSSSAGSLPSWAQ